MILSGFGIVLLFIIGGITFILITLGVGKILRPSRPYDTKLTTYESGEEPVLTAWTGLFNVRFYVIALVFLLFEVELVFLFPWAIVFGNADKIAETNGAWGWFALIEIVIFVGLLVVGLAYVWAKGMLDWARPTVNPATFDSKVPSDLYESVNKKYS